MRYIIIPLAIIAYIVWSYYGIKELIEDYKLNKKYPVENPIKDAIFMSNSHWVMFHVIGLCAVAICGLGYLTIKYW